MSADGPPAGTEETEMAGIISYEVVRPSDGEKLAIHETVWDAENDAINYAVVDEESIVVVRVIADRHDRIIIAVAHPSAGALFRTVGRGGRVADDDLEVLS
jgi:hypothetical protein